MAFVDKVVSFISKHVSGFLQFYFGVNLFLTFFKANEVNKLYKYAALCAKYENNLERKKTGLAYADWVLPYSLENGVCCDGMACHKKTKCKLQHNRCIFCKQDHFGIKEDNGDFSFRNAANSENCQCEYWNEIKNEFLKLKGHEIPLTRLADLWECRKRFQKMFSKQSQKTRNKNYCRGSDRKFKLPDGSSLGGKWNVESKLGKGTNGTVYKAKYTGIGRRPPKEVAVKVLDDSSTFHGVNEVEHLKELNSEHIVQLIGYFNNVFGPEKKAIIVMELCNGDLGDFVDQYEGDNYKEFTRSAMCQLVNAYSYCHAKGVLHRDVKPKNILVKRLNGSNIDDVQLKICDFAFAKLSKPDGTFSHYSQAGTTEKGFCWMAPEIIKAVDSTTKYDMAADVFSLGCVFYFIATKNSNKVGLFEDQGAVIDEKADEIRSEKLDIVGFHLPLETDIIRRMTYQDPLRRLSLGVMQSHPALWTNIDFDHNLHYVQRFIKTRRTEGAQYLQFSNEIEANSEDAIGNDWFSKFPVEIQEIVINSKRIKQTEKDRYKNSCDMHDLIQIIRNWLEHKAEVASENTEYENLFQLVTHCFPNFLPILWDCMRKYGTFKGTNFQKCVPDSK